MPEIGQLLQRAAHEPSDRFDVADVQRRAGRLRRARRARTGLLAAAVVLLAVPLTGLLDAMRDDELVQLAPGGGLLPDDQTGQADACPAAPLPFKPTVLPAAWSEELHTGAGGGTQTSGALGHWGESDASFIDLFRGRTLAIDDERARPIRVLGRDGVIGPAGDRFVVAFGTGAGVCDQYSLVGVDVTWGELQRFSEGLVPDPADESRWAAIWPEDTHDAARSAGGRITAGATDAGGESWRFDPAETAIEFAEQVLGWQGAIVSSVPSGSSSFPDGTGDALRILQPAPDGPALEIRLIRVTVSGQDVWSVSSLWGFPGEGEDYSASVSVLDGSVQVSFGYWGEAASAELRMGYGGEQIVHIRDRPPAEWELELPFAHDASGHVMILFRDARGQVFAGWGTPLPSGDFAAG